MPSRGKVRCRSCGFDGAVVGVKPWPYKTAPKSWRDGVCALCVWQRRRR